LTLVPIAAAPAAIQLHVAAALIALLAGVVTIVLRKGTALHRRIGWAFVVAMGVTALTSLFIMRDGQFSAIHLLTALTVVALPYGVLMRRRGNIRAHRSAMISLLLGLVIAGAFTLMPGRLMHQITLGQASTPR
jgi:uncharacterized membrane protein